MKTTGNEHLDTQLAHLEEIAKAETAEKLIEVVRDVAELAVETRHLQIGDAEIAEGKKLIPPGMSIRELDARVSRVEAWQRQAVFAEEAGSEHPLAMADEIMKNYKGPDWLHDEASRDTAHDLVTFETVPAPHMSKDFRAKLEGVEPIPLAKVELINLDHLELRLVKSVVVLQENLAAVVAATEVEGEELSVLRGAMFAIVDHLKEGVSKCRFEKTKVQEPPVTLFGREVVTEEQITGLTIEPIQWERIQQALDFAMKALDGKPTVASGATQTLRDIRRVLEPGPDKPPSADLISEVLRLCDAALMPKVRIEDETKKSRRDLISAMKPRTRDDDDTD